MKIVIAFSSEFNLSMYNTLQNSPLKSSSHHMKHTLHYTISRSHFIPSLSMILISVVLGAIATTPLPVAISSGISSTKWNISRDSAMRSSLIPIEASTVVCPAGNVTFTSCSCKSDAAMTWCQIKKLKKEVICKAQTKSCHANSHTFSCTILGHHFDRKIKISMILWGLHSDCDTSVSLSYHVHGWTELHTNYKHEVQEMPWNVVHSLYYNLKCITLPGPWCAYSCMTVTTTYS